MLYIQQDYEEVVVTDIRTEKPWLDKDSWTIIPDNRLLTRKWNDVDDADKK